MGFFKKMMAAVGVGGARIDTHLTHAEAAAGEELRGVIHVTGGAVEQRIERLNLELMTRYRDGEEYATYSLFSVPVGGGFDLRPGERREFPFGLPVPHGTPLSAPGTELWLATDADIAGAIDPGDTDPVRIVPDERQGVLFQAFEALGFGVRSSEVNYHHGQLIQELSFVPPFPAEIAEVEVMTFPAHGGLEVVLEVDRRARGMASLFIEEFESRSRWFIPDAQLAQGPQALAHELSHRLQQH